MQPDQIEIKDFIFHIVNEVGRDEPRLFDKIDLEGFELHFQKIICDVYLGSQFYFTQESNFLRLANRINQSPGLFVEISKEYARLFHKVEDKRSKPGVLIFMHVLIDGKPKYVLIKNDNMAIITYSHDGTRAHFSELDQTIAKHKDAIQKTAIIDIWAPQPFCLATNKSDKSGIAQYFKLFLGVKRKYTDTGLTMETRDALLTTARVHKDELPAKFMSSASQRFYDYVQTSESFEKDLFLQYLFEGHLNDNIIKTFEKVLKAKDILGEEFNWDKNIKKPKITKYKTEEGITINIPADAEDTFSEKTTGNTTVITITTTKLIQEK